MSRMHAARADFGPPDGLIAADVLLRQEPNEEEEEEEEEEDESNGKEDADDNDATDDGYSEWARS